MHVDLDAFFVEVCRQHDPRLQAIDLLVVGGRRDSRGVVQSASYGARAFGVRSAMPIAEAVRRCPDATFITGEFANYRAASRAVAAVLERFAPQVVMTGLDEGYLDMTGTDLIHPVSLLDHATALRHAVKAETGLDCSIGIGPNRMVAKICSDFGKPRGVCEVRAGWEAGFMAGLPLKAIPGVGPKSAARLAGHGLVNVHEVQALTLAELERLVGRDEADWLTRRTRGEGSGRVRSRSKAKSVSRETTFFDAVSDPDELDRVLLLLTSRVAGQLRDADLRAGSVVIKLRHADFRTITRQAPLKPASALDGPILAAARQLLAPAFREARQHGQAIRLLGVGTTNLVPAIETDLFEALGDDHGAGVARAVDRVRAKFGFGAVGPGRLVKPPKPEDDE
jgi:DNA polymerase-4